jgi:iron complex transport system substrate-binding protein
MRDGLSLYQVDEKLLRELAPDIIMTQDLCQVCAPSGNEVTEALNLLPKKPQILWLTPKSLEEIFDNLRQLGGATGRLKEAEKLIAAGRVRLEKLAAVTRNLSHRHRVFCMEWLDPVYCSGHWMPEMVEIAGGVDALSREGADSVRIPWDDVLEWAPEVLIITPCGFNLEKVIEQSQQLTDYSGWSELPAVREGRVYAVDANSYFARPGPRVVEGTELLAHLIHPKLFSWDGPPSAYKRLEL